MGLPSLVAICRFESDGRYSVKNERKGKSMNIDKCQYCGGSGEECFGCGGSGEYVKAFFKCGVEGCGHVVDVPDPLDIRAYDNRKRDMVNHYRWDHADMIGTRRSTPGVPFSDYYVYRPIPDNIGPSFSYNGTVNSWAETCKYEGRM